MNTFSFYVSYNFLESPFEMFFINLLQLIKYIDVSKCKMQLST